jgi:NADPH:quinone reductase-like Zn-dependent oxidoreductase
MSQLSSSPYNFPGSFGAPNAGRRGRGDFKEDSMKAIVRTQYGSPDVLQFAEVPTPIPAGNEVLIKLCAASVNPVDLFVLQGAPWNRIPGLRATPKNTIIGCDIAGRVEAVGRSVKQFQAGDEVFGVTGFEGKGFAEYVCASEEKLASKPANLSFEDAAAVPIAAITALQGLRDWGRMQPGHKVLIEGASGGVGTFAVQIAKELGAEVTAVCSTRNVDIAKSIGADHVIDYTKVDFARLRQRYDLILAVNGHHSIFQYRRMLSRNGIYVAIGGLVPILQALLLGRLLSALGHKKMTFFIAKIDQRDLVFLKSLLQAGTIVPVIDRRYLLSDAAEALRYLAEGHAQGKVVLTVPPD